MARAFCCCSSRTRRSAKRDDREFWDEVEVEGEEGGGGEAAGERADFKDAMKVLSGVSGVSFVTREPFLFLVSLILSERGEGGRRQDAHFRTTKYGAVSAGQNIERKLASADPAFSLKMMLLSLSNGNISPSRRFSLSHFMLLQQFSPSKILVPKEPSSVIRARSNKPVTKNTKGLSAFMASAEPSWMLPL